jgi:predicted exporter
MQTNRIIVMLLWLLLALAALVVAASLRITTDMSAFLPGGGEGQEPLLLEQLQSGSSTRVLLLAIEGAKPTELAGLSSALADALREDKRFIQVLNGELSLADTAQGVWFDYRYLLQHHDFSQQAMRQALLHRLQELRGPLGLYTRRTLAEDPTAAYPALLRQWQGEVQPELRHGVWFSADDRALLLAETAAPGFDLDTQEQNVAALRREFAGLAANSGAELVVTGAPAIAVASRATIRSEAQRASIAAALAVALILLFAYRSLRLWLLSALPLLGAVLLALASTTLLFGSVHGITLAFGIILLGVAIDYPVHLFSHLRPGDPPSVALQHIWPTLRLGVASTAIGFAALLLSRFEGLQQLGVFAVSGLLGAALITRYLVPELLPRRWQGRAFTRPATAAMPRPVARLAVVASLLLIAVAYLSLSERTLWQRDITALSPVPQAQLQQERTLREALPVGDLNRLLLMQADDAESLLQAQERLSPRLQQWVAEGVIGGFSLAAQRLPSRARQQRIRQSLPGTAQLEHNLAQASEGMPFRSGAFAPFIEAMERSRGLPLLTLEQVRATPLGLPLAGLLFQRDGRWWGVIRLSGLEDATLLQQRLEGLPGTLRYVDLGQLSGSMLDGYRQAALKHLAWGALLIVLLIGFASRSLRRLVQVVLPLSAAIALTLALQHALGERLSLFHLTSLLLVAGIGIDYGLFFSRGDTAEERGRTRHALGVCATSTLTVFAILALSQLPVLHAIGSTVAIGVVAAYLLARFAASDRREEPVAAGVFPVENSAR